MTGSILIDYKVVISIIMNLSNKIISSGCVLCKTLIYIILCCEACRPSPVNQQNMETDAILSVYFFHLTARCEACTAVEENTVRVLDKYYKSQLKSGTIGFRSINIDDRENRALTERYKISYTSLLLVRADGTFTDFTNTALNYANMAPARFEELLKMEIDKNLE